MAVTTLSSAVPAIVIDANVLIALCAKEVLKFPHADAQIERYTKAGYIFYAPGVIVAETLYALCRQLTTGLITANSYSAAIATLDGYLQPILYNGPKNLDIKIV